MNERPNHDDPRDPHLLAALRHAPDRDALPPHEVSARILAAARAAVRPVPAVAWWQRVGAWLVQPQIAASFGTLAVASIVGLMWSTREPPVDEPALRERVAEQAPATSAVASTAAAPDAVEPAVASAERRRDERDLLAQTIPAAPAPKPEEAPRRAKEVKAPAAQADARPAPAPPSEPVAEKMAAGQTSAAAPPAARREDARAAEAAAMADAAPSADSANAVGAAKASRPRVATSPVPARESPSLQGLTAARSASAPVDPLTRIDALLAGGDATWSNAARTLPHGPAQAAWWAQLWQATVGAWQPALPPRADASALTLAPALTLRVAGQSIASIDFAADGVWWCPADRSACWRAPISAAQREAWIAEVARW